MEENVAYGEYQPLVETENVAPFSCQKCQRRFETLRRLAQYIVNIQATVIIWNNNLILNRKIRAKKNKNHHYLQACSECSKENQKRIGTIWVCMLTNEESLRSWRCMVMVGEISESNCKPDQKDILKKKIIIISYALRKFMMNFLKRFWHADWYLWINDQGWDQSTWQKFLGESVQKVVMSVTKEDVIGSCSIGSCSKVKMCPGQAAGSKAAIHSMRDIFESEESEAVLLVDAANTHLQQHQP